MKGNGYVEHSTPFKVFAQAFFKKLAVSKGSALVARRNERNLLNGAFLFAKLFLLRLVCQKKKRHRRRIFFNYGSGRPLGKPQVFFENIVVAPTGACAVFDILFVGTDVLGGPFLE